MQRNHFLAALCLAVVSLCPVCAQSQYIGYTVGGFVRKNGINLSSDLNMGMAIHLSQAKAQALKGRTIKGIRAMFGTKQISNFNIFVTKELGGTPISQTTQSGPSTALKDFYFDTPVTIDGNELYVGYTFTLVADNYKPLMVDYTSDFAEGTVYSYINGQWVDLAGQNVGGPSVQLILDEVPEFNDLVLKPFSSTKYYRGGDNFELTAQLFNFGSTTVTSFDATIQVGNETPQTLTVSDVNIEPNTVYNFTVPGINANTVGFAKVSIEISKVNGHDDADASDNTSSACLCIFPQDMQRKYLIENFTGQACSNCPRGHEEINTFISGHEDDFVIVAHHSGYQPDMFTMTEDGNYTWFYADGRTFAPAAMLNRAPYTGGATTCVWGNDGSGLSKGFSTAYALREVVQPYVSVGMQNSYDPATRQCKIDVVVHTYSMPSSELHTLNVWLTQDGLEAYQMNGGSNYSHNHVFRGSLTGTWGDVIELNEGETITRSYEYTLPDSIAASYEGSDYTGTKFEVVPENMHWVAFVGDATASPLTCTVWNVNTIDVTNNGATTAISAVDSSVNAPAIHVDGSHVALSGSCAPAAVYNISGQRVATLQNGQSITLPQGVYVVKAQGAKAQKVIVR